MWRMGKRPFCAAERVSTAGLARLIRRANGFVNHNGACGMGFRQDFVTRRR
jgi:hypothetical protein